MRAIERAGMPVSLPMDTAKVGFGNVPSQALKELGCALDAEAMAKASERAAPGEVVKPIYLQSGPLSTLIDRVLVTVHHVPMYQQKLRNILYPNSSQFFDKVEFEKLHRYHVLFTAIERDRISDGEADEVKRFGQVWVPCEANRYAMLRSGIPEEKVKVVPHPMPVERYALLANAKRESGRFPRSEGGRERPYVFYSIGKWEPRKNHVGLIRSFMSAFKPDGKNILLLKTSAFSGWRGYPKTPSDAISELLQLEGVKKMGWTPDLASKYVKVNSDFVSEEHIFKMHGMGDCYVSASHGEGWDLPAYDAMVAGSHIVSPRTGWMGDVFQPDLFKVFFTPVMSGGTEPCHHSYGWGISRWLTVEDESLACAMGLASSESRSGIPGATRESSSFGSVGRLVVDNICELVGMSMDEMKEKWGHGLPEHSLVLPRRQGRIVRIPCARVHGRVPRLGDQVRCARLQDSSRRGRVRIGRGDLRHRHLRRGAYAPGVAQHAREAQGAFSRAGSQWLRCQAGDPVRL